MMKEAAERQVKVRAEVGVRYGSYHIAKERLLEEGGGKGAGDRMEEEAERQAKAEAEVGVGYDSYCVRVSSKEDLREQRGQGQDGGGGGANAQCRGRGGCRSAQRVHFWEMWWLGG